MGCFSVTEKSAGSKMGGCFPGQGQVVTPRGPVPLRAVRAGDLVQVMREDGTLAFSPVLMFLHRDPGVSRAFLRLTTHHGTTLTLTASHLVFLLEAELAGAAPTVQEALQMGGVVLAGRVEAGDFLLVAREGGVTLEKVVGVSYQEAGGVFAPLTTEGTVVVDGVVASCYAVIDSQAIAHWAFLPVRLYNNLREALLAVLRAMGGLALPSTTVNTTNTTIITAAEATGGVRLQEGEHAANTVVEGEAMHIHWYPRLLYTLARWLLPKHLVYS